MGCRGRDHLWLVGSSKSLPFSRLLGSSEEATRILTSPPSHGFREGRQSTRNLAHLSARELLLDYGLHSRAGNAMWPMSKRVEIRLMAGWMIP